MFSFFSKGQNKLDTKFAEANSKMRVQNMYQRIIWDMKSTNAYLFDQTEGWVKYMVEEKGYEVIALPKLLGTFNLDDQTFLWADQNPSVNKALSDEVNSFREALPKKYHSAKFNSTTAFNKDLLSLFSDQLGANGFDNQRQGNTIIYYALLEIDVHKDGKLFKNIDLNQHTKAVSRPDLIQLLKTFHKEQVEVNALHQSEKISLDEAFDRIKAVHLKYWLNEDSYFFPSLSWPCDFDEEKIQSWEAFEIEGRLFVLYTTDLGWTMESYAYEIDSKAKGEKIIINFY